MTRGICKGRGRKPVQQDPLPDHVESRLHANGGGAVIEMLQRRIEPFFLQRGEKFTKPPFLFIGIVQIFVVGGSKMAEDAFNFQPGAGRRSVSAFSPSPGRAESRSSTSPCPARCAPSRSCPCVPPPGERKRVLKRRDRTGDGPFHKGAVRGGRNMPQHHDRRFDPRPAKRNRLVCERRLRNNRLSPAKGRRRWQRRDRKRPP